MELKRNILDIDGLKVGLYPVHSVMSAYRDHLQR